MWPRTSIVEADRTLRTKPRNPLEDSLGANSKIPRHRCGHLAIQHPGNHKRTAVWASLSIGVKLHDPFLSSEMAEIIARGTQVHRRSHVRNWQILLQKSPMGDANCALAPSCRSLRRMKRRR